MSNIDDLIDSVYQATSVTQSDARTAFTRTKFGRDIQHQTMSLLIPVLLALVCGVVLGLILHLWCGDTPEKKRALGSKEQE